MNEEKSIEVIFPFQSTAVNISQDFSICGQIPYKARCLEVKEDMFEKIIFVTVNVKLIHLLDPQRTHIILLR